MDCDIVHLHWVSRHILKTSDICKINKPIVYTLHDMWPMTGGVTTLLIVKNMSKVVANA